MCTYLLITFSTGEVTFVLAISHTTQWGLCACVCGVCVVCVVCAYEETEQQFW